MRSTSISAAVLFLLFASSMISAQSQPGDQYKLLFATRKGDDVKKWRYSDDWINTWESETSELGPKINSLTRNGNRLRTLYLPFAIVSTDNYSYDYSVYNAASSPLSGAVPQGGYSVFDHFWNGSLCYSAPMGSSDNETCSEFETYVEERPLTVTQIVDQFVIDDPGDEPADILDKKFAEGYFPRTVISKSEMVLTRGQPLPDVARHHPNFLIVQKNNSFEKKVNDLANQGYRILLAEDKIAVMYRDDETRGKSVSYEWIDGAAKNLPGNLRKLERVGAKYATLVSDSKGNKNTLIFEIPQSPSKPSEFKVLRFPVEWKRDPADGKNYLDLMPEGRESEKQITGLVKQGFAVRDLFQFGDVTLLMEREH